MAKRILNSIIISFLLVFSVSNTYASERIALVIGNSNYKDLGTLKNTPNDARAMGNSLRELGYNVTLVLDASEGDMRKSVRKFSSDSDKSSLALVFYAGHGAQVNGENYLLPVDMEIPKTESDIQLQGFKVDDLINSLRSKTKVVFLDACRDNPALIKNLAKGRGSYRGGLAPAKTGSIDDQSSGIFIAYATDSGNVALDGEGQNNSPFTSALLKYIKNPVSIDDMFSMVTKDVRQSTKNNQRPYKYASLDGIVCIPGACYKNESSDNVIKPGVIQSNVSPNKDVSKDNWVLWTVGFADKSLVYVDPSSIVRSKNRIYIDVKFVYLKKFLEFNPRKSVKSDEYGYVLDCESDLGEVVSIKSFDWDNKKITDQILGDITTIELKTNFNKGSIANAFKFNACNTNLLKPMFTQTELKSNPWKRIYTLKEGYDLYYLDIEHNKTKPIETYLMLKMPAIKVSEMKSELGIDNFFSEYGEGAPMASLFVTKALFDCKGNYLELSSNYFNQNGDLVSFGNFRYDEASQKLLDLLPLAASSAADIVSKKLCN